MPAFNLSTSGSPPFRTLNPTIPQNLVTDPLVSGTTDPGGVVLVSVDGKPQVAVTADGNGNWAYRDPTLPDGAVGVDLVAPNANSTVEEQYSFAFNATAPVVLAYQDIFGRTPSQAEIGGWRGALVNGQSVLSVRSALATSAEATNDINALYSGVLARGADPAGLAGWQNALANGSSLAAVRFSLATSAEAQGDINALYASVLGRGADPAGLAGWQGALAVGGASLASIRASLATSPEAANDIEGFYTSLLGRSADPAGLAGWQGALASGAVSLAGIQSGIAGSSEAHSHTPAAPVLQFLQAQPSLQPLGNSDTLYTAGTVTPTGTGDLVQGFDIARDFFQIPASQYGSFAALQPNISAQSGGTLVALSTNEQILLAGVTPSQLGAGNFHLV
jgi:hypothetical protein